MISRALLLAFAAVVSLAGSPAAAQQVLPPGQIDASGNLKMGPVTLGKRQGTKFTITPDNLQIKGPGSTGPVDGMTVAGRPFSSFISDAGGKTTLTPDAFTGDGSGASAAPPGGELRTIAQALSDEINVKSLKANVCTGSEAIDTAALNLAISKATLAPGTTIRLPSCTYKLRVTAGTNGFRLPSGTTLRGDGPRAVITWNDAEATDANPLFLFGPNDAGVRTADIAFRDFTVRGSAATTGHTAAYPFLPTQVDGLSFRGITSEYSRTFSIAARSSTGVSADGNVIRFGKADGINFAQCTRVSVRSNDIAHVNDDSIGIHSDIYDPEKVRDSVVVSGNRVFDAQGIRVLSARKAAITANILTNVRQFGVSLETLAAVGSGFQEGASAAEASSITANIITNVIDRAYVDNFNQGANAIVITGSSARKGSLAAVPGSADPATGIIPDPYRETFANSSASTVATPGSGAVIVSQNVIARTLPPSDGTDPRYKKWSDFGFGPMWTNSGNSDPSLPAAALQATAFYLRDGTIRDLTMSSNIVRGLGSGLVVGNGQRFDNILFKTNQLIDLKSFGVIINTSGKLRIYIDDNTFDLDPYHNATTRGPNGTWTSAGTPIALYQQAGSGVFFRHNTLRNTNMVFNQGLGLAGYYFAENYAEADIASFGAFSTSNKGIGSVPENSARLRYVRVGSDPANDNFGTVLAVPAYP